MNRGKIFYTPINEFHPELQPNGRIVRCIEDFGNGYLKVTTDGDMSKPNIWIMSLKYLREVL